MKVLKWILILAVVFVLIVVAGVLYVFNSASFQKSVVEGVLKDEVTVQEFGYFKASLSTIKLNSLTIEKDGKVITLADVAIKYSAMDALFNKEIRVEEVKVSGLVVDLRGPELATVGTAPVVSDKSKSGQSTTSAKPSQPAQPTQVAHDDDDDFESEPFKGIFSHGALPFKLYLGTVAVEAKVLLPNNREVNATVTGGGVEPGTTGNVVLAVKFVDVTEGAELKQAEVNAKLALTQNDDSEVTRIVLEMDVTGESTTVKDTPKLVLNADLSQASDKTETYVISLTESERKGAPIAALDATFDPATDRLKGKAIVQAGHEQVAGLVPSEKTPDFAMDGTIAFDLGTVSGEGTLDAQIKLVLDQLTRVRPELAGLGSVTVTTALAADGTKEALTLKTLNMQVNSASQGPLMKLENLQTVVIPTDKDASLPTLNGDIVRLVLQQLPLSLVDPWVKDIALSGQPISTTIVVSGEGEGSYQITAPQGLTLNDLSVSKGGESLLSKVSISANPVIHYAPDKVTVDLAALKMTSSTLPLVNGQANVVMNPQSKQLPNGHVTATLSGDLAQLLKQPVLDSLNNVSTGTFDTELDIDFDQEGAFTLKAEVKNVLTRQPMKQVSRLLVDAKGHFDPPARIEIQTPFKLNTGEGNTDVTLNATLAQPESGREFDVTLKGPQLDADGMMLLAAAFKNPTPRPAAAVQGQPAAAVQGPTAPATTPSAKPATETARAPLPMGPGPVRLGANGKPLPASDKVPFWSGNTGTVEVVVDKLYYGKYRLDDATAKLVLEPNQLKIDPLSAGFAGAPLKADATITFTSGDLPYALNSQLTLSDLDIGKFLAQEKPGTLPSVTGLFNIGGGAFGKGPTMPALLQDIQGKFSLEGRKGNLRPLTAAGQNTATAGVVLGGILGAISGNQGNQRTAVQTAQQLVQIMQDIPYDRFALVAVRGENLDINLTEIALTAPTISMNGTGVIKYIDGKAITDQPLQAEIKLGAKEKTAQMLSDLKLLSGKEGKDGYTEAFSFPVTGTLSKLDFSVLYNKLISSAVALAAEGINGKPATTTGNGETATEPMEKKSNSGADAVKGLLDSFLR